MRETIRTNDADLYVGWPTTSEDLDELGAARSPFGPVATGLVTPATDEPA